VQRDGGLCNQPPSQGVSIGNEVEPLTADVLLIVGGADVALAVIRVWYSLCISEEDFSLLLSALQDLVTTELCTLTGDVMEISADQLNDLRDVWITWLRLAERKGPWVANLRQEAILRDSGIEGGIENYLHAIPKEHRVSAQRFFNTGIFPSTENTEGLRRENPTLTGRGYLRLSNISEYHYSIPMDVLPFTGWDFSAIKKICHVDSLPEMYSIYVSQIIHKVVERLRKNQVKFQFILADVLNIETFLPASLKYDRITTSNLWDYCPLTVLLTQFKGFLNGSNPHAVMLTETDNWVRNMPEVIHVLPQLWGIDDLIRKALQDTQNPELATSSGMSAVVEYFNISSEFLMFLRASLLVSSTGKDLASLKQKKRIPSLKSLVGSLGLHLRDFTRNENTVFPFKWALNCRRVTMLRGFERTLEWKLPALNSQANKSDY